MAPAAAGRCVAPRLNLRQAFFVTTRGDNALVSDLAGDTEPGKQAPTPTLLTLESLTYPTALVVVTAGTAAFRFFAGPWADGRWVALVVAVLYVGSFLANSWASLSDRGKQLAATGIAALNALIVAAVAAGAKDVADALTSTS